MHASQATAGEPRGPGGPSTRCRSVKAGVSSSLPVRDGMRHPFSGRVTWHLGVCFQELVASTFHGKIWKFKINWTF